MNNPDLSGQSNQAKLEDSRYPPRLLEEVGLTESAQ